VCITWDQVDALPFDLPVGPYHAGVPGSDTHARQLSVALRNIVLVDHGAWVGPETLPPVSSGERYRPYLTYNNVTYAAGYDHAEACSLPASAAIAQHPWDAQAVVEVTEQRTLLLPEAETYTPLVRKTRDNTGSTQFASIHRWVQRRDLLSSDRTARTFVVETEDDGRAYLRFGFGGLGKGPSSNDTLVASYRIGNGSQGNVGRHAIGHLVTDDQSLAEAITEVRNPLSVTGGIDAESIEAARVAAPYAFQTPRSCISPDDYAALALRFPRGGVRQARARIELTGNWQTVFVYVQRQEGRSMDPGFREQLLAWLRPRAMSGYEVAIRPPRTVGLELHLGVSVAPHRFRSVVRQAVERALGNGLQENGQPGFFHPDSLTFAQSIYASQVIRAVMAVDGVARVEIVRFGRLPAGDARFPDPDPVPIGELEIARLDADPDHPEHGTLCIDMEGGV
jgi:hypothetical protein